MGRKHLQKSYLIKDCYPKYKKNSYNPTVRKQRTPLKNGSKDLNIHLNKEDTQMASKHTKRYSTSYVNREMQSKTKMRHHHTSIREVKIHNTNNSKC